MRYHILRWTILFLAITWISSGIAVSAAAIGADSPVASQKKENTDRQKKRESRKSQKDKNVLNSELVGENPQNVIENESDVLSPEIKKGSGANKNAETGESANKAKNEDTEFMRVRFDKKSRDANALETAIVRYTCADDPDSNIQVDLIAAVHVGEPEYYDQLNKHFTYYDSVLYELVSENRGDRPTPEDAERSNHPVSIIQQMMTDVLELEFQLEGIDYSPKNFVHADMTAEEFAKSMKERNESFLKMFMNMMLDAMAKDAGGSNTSDAEMLFALFSKNRSLRLKRIMAEQFGDMESSMSSLDGPNGSTLVTERNKVALKVLSDRLKKGDTKLAIFYGAGHMADFDKRLRDEFGLTPAKTRWLKAWNMDESLKK